MTIQPSASCVLLHCLPALPTAPRKGPTPVPLPKGHLLKVCLSAYGTSLRRSVTGRLGESQLGCQGWASEGDIRTLDPSPISLLPAHLSPLCIPAMVDSTHPSPQQGAKRL